MIYDINLIANQIRDEINSHSEKGSLTIISTSDDYASEKYVNNKIKTGIELGFNVQVLKCDSTEQVINTIDHCNTDGVIVQLPLGNGINLDEIVEHIPYKKDVDGFTDFSVANLYNHKSTFTPCTPLGIIRIIENYFSLSGLAGLNVVIIERSNLVGKPLAVSLINRGCTVTCCNLKTKNLSAVISNADVIVTATGKAGLINKQIIQQRLRTFTGHIPLIIDVGITRSADGKLCGDVDKALYNINGISVTPVPGGVGKLTVLCLYLNVIRAHQLNRN